MAKHGRTEKKARETSHHPKDQAVEIKGPGDELHQIAGNGHPPLTTQTGAIVADDENSLRAGDRGPTLLEDHVFLEKIQHFDHERIPERIVHARGFGAHGYFELTESLGDESVCGTESRKYARTRDVALGNLTGLRMAIQAAGAEDLAVGDRITLECTDLQPTGKGNPRIDFKIVIHRPN